MTTDTPLLRVVTIDDEEHSNATIQIFLKKYCENVAIVGTASSADEARTVIAATKPDAIFLDIQMPNEDGFALLRSMPERDFSVVFVTAYDQHAISAIKAGAIDYLLKPLDIDDLRSAVERLRVRKESRHHDTVQDYARQIQSVLDHLHTGLPTKLTKISVPMSNGYQMRTVADISRCESDNNDTTFFLNNNKQILVSKPIKDYEEMLEGSGFVRVHRSHLVNLAHVEKFIQKSYVVMSDKTVVEVARRKTEELLARIQTL